MSRAAARAAILEAQGLSARYGRVAGAALGRSRGRRKASWWRCWGRTAPGNRPCCARSWGSPDARARCAFNGQACRSAIRPRSPARGIVMVPEGRGIFGPMSVAREPAARRLSCSAGAAPEFERRLERVLALFPRLQGTPRPDRRLAVGRRAADARGRSRADGRAEAAAARRALARTCAQVTAEILETLGRAQPTRACPSCWSSRRPRWRSSSRERAYVISNRTHHRRVDPREIKSHDELARVLPPLARRCGQPWATSRRCSARRRSSSYAIVAGGYFVTLAGFAVIYAIFVTGLNFFMGYAGQASFGQNAFAAHRRLHLGDPDHGLWLATAAGARRRGGRRGRLRGPDRLSDPAAERPLPRDGDVRARADRLRDHRPVAVGHPGLHGHLRHPAARHRQLRGRERPRAARRCSRVLVGAVHGAAPADPSFALRPRAAWPSPAAKMRRARSASTSRATSSPPSWSPRSMRRSPARCSCTSSASSARKCSG